MVGGVQARGEFAREAPFAFVCTATRNRHESSLSHAHGRRGHTRPHRYIARRTSRASTLRKALPSARRVIERPTPQAPQVGPASHDRRVDPKAAASGMTVTRITAGAAGCRMSSKRRTRLNGCGSLSPELEVPPSRVPHVLLTDRNGGAAASVRLLIA
jgi:hypothetical protein